ncbi:AraC family transcriptional regulator [Niabella sp. CJ426]|uniref:AraC family transcriptional regulator n=1 Tax=Niabella sp. CJ426 TaxID=3393740 RepID=UPI003D03DC0C
MKRYRQYEPLLIADFTANKWQHPLHNHNHYELIYIKAGKGVHVINGVTFPYDSGDIFLIGPEETHRFEIEQPTYFIYLKFTDQYMHRAGGQIRDGVQHLEYLVKSRETHFAGFKLSTRDSIIVDRIFNVVLSLKADSFANDQLIWMQVLSLAAILQRNMPELKPAGPRHKDMQAVFCYIHKNIYYPDLLKAVVMAGHFNVSPDYIGPYFKRSTGITLRQYISDYRYNIIRQRIGGGNYSLKQIASDFGLTDESHVSKILRVSK